MNWHSVIDALVETEKDPMPTSVPTVAPTTATNLASSLQPLQSTTVVLTAPIPAAPAEGFLAKLRAKTADTADPVSKLEATLASLTAITDPGVRVQAAVGVLAATAAIPLSQLQACYSYRLSMLEQQSAQFAAAISAQQANEITTREKAVAQAAADINSHSAAIQELDAKCKVLNEEIIAAKTKLAAAQAGFTAAAATLKQELTEAANRLTGASQ